MEIGNLEKIAKDLLSTEGKVRGEVLINHAEHIKWKDGEKGLEKVKQRMAELGASVDFNSIGPMQWKKAALDDLLVLVSCEVLGWTEKDVFEMGYFNSRVSFVTKALARYLASKEKMLQHVSRYWKSYYDVGSVEVKEQGENYVVLAIKEYKSHPLICRLFAGYMYGLAELLSKNQEIEVKETKCIHENDDHHEFLVTWK